MSLTALLVAAALAVRGALPAPADAVAPRDARRPFLRASAEAAALRSKGDYELALAALERAARVASDPGLGHYRRQSLLRLALLRWDLGLVPDSLAGFVEAGAAYGRAGDRRGEELCALCAEVVGLYEAGKRDRGAGLFGRSLDRFERAVSLARQAGLPGLEVKCLRQQGLVHWETGRLEEFLELSERALRVAEAYGHRAERGRSLNNIGAALFRMGDHSRALDRLEEALAAVRAAGDRPTEAECLGNLGILYRDLGNHARALDCLTAALGLDRESGDRRAVAAGLANQGSVLLSRGLETGNAADLAEARRALEECVALLGAESGNDPLGFTALNDIGIILGEQGDAAGARRSFEKALRVVEGQGRDLEEGCVLSNIAASHLAANDLPEALKRFRAAYSLGLRSGLENVVIGSAFGLGRCYELAGERDRALEHYAESVSALEGVRERLSSEVLMAGFSRGRLGAYHRAIGILAGMQLERPSPDTLERIFDLMERAKARAFLENVRRAGDDRGGASAAWRAERKRRSVARIARISERLKEPGLREEDWAALNLELEREEEEHFRLLAHLGDVSQEAGPELAGEVVGLAEVRRRAAETGTALFEYWLGEEMSLLLLVTPGGADLFPLAGKAAIEASLRGFIKLLSDGSIEAREGHAAAERIGRELMPFDWQARLVGAGRAVVVPDGILHSLPFEAVRVRLAGGPVYLVEACAVSTCPSASSLAAIDGREKGGGWTKDLLAFGGPALGSEAEAWLRKLYGERAGELAPLPYSRREVADVAKLFDGRRADVLVGEEASEAAVKRLPLGDYRILHFACHGLLDERHPLRSALVLAPAGGRGEDGLLQTREIYGLRTRADLVVLSACQTARGSLEYAEGPLGLARSFFFSGARSVLATLWPVGDRAAVFLMGEFYRNYLSGRPAGEALRLAKLRMLDSPWSHPHHWAGYALSGDPGYGPAAGN